ncbi:MAG: alpha/beta hydrolase [Atopobiaceae bacterium]|nr:alpha/beta hydrolase [Atopobiaceae bacterium]
MTWSHFKETKRLRIAYRRVGEGNSRKLLFLHGNLSSSEYILPLFPFLEDDFDVVAPDLRCFGDTDALAVDATRGYRDFSDDVFALVEALDWKSFSICGWSMGGNVAMQFAIDHPDMVERLLFLAPGSPYGFGGSYDEQGTPYAPLGLGSGAGAANPGLLLAIEHGSRFVLRDVLTKYYFNPPFRMERIWENRLIDAIGKISIGTDRFPGNYTHSEHWPYVVAGDKGVLNAMSSAYGDVSDFLTIPNKIPVLWIHGDNDRIVSDESLLEFGYLGKLGLVPGWPGPKVYPPQPMLSQLRNFFEQYRQLGGSADELIIPGGHMCALESTDYFIEGLKGFLL